MHIFKLNGAKNLRCVSGKIFFPIAGPGGGKVGRGPFRLRSRVLRRHDPSKGTFCNENPELRSTKLRKNSPGVEKTVKKEYVNGKFRLVLRRVKNPVPSNGENMKEVISDLLRRSPHDHRGGDAATPSQT